MLFDIVQLKKKVDICNFNVDIYQLQFLNIYIFTIERRIVIPEITNVNFKVRNNNSETVKYQLENKCIVGNLGVTWHMFNFYGAGVVTRYMFLFCVYRRSCILLDWYNFILFTVGWISILTFLKIPASQQIYWKSRKIKTSVPLI